MTTLRRRLTALFKRQAWHAGCDTCVFVDFFRSNGDGQSARLQAFCRCPQGPFRDRPIPLDRHCDFWQQSSRPADKPRVGDPNLSV